MKRENVKYTVRTEQRSFMFDHVHIFPQNQLTLHQQDSWELSYIIKGRGVRAIGDTIAPFTEGEIILIPPNIPHCWVFDEEACDEEGKIENITIIFPDNFLQGISIIFMEFLDVIKKVQSNKDALSFSGKTLSQLQELMIEMITQTHTNRISSLFSLLEIISSSKKEKNIVGCLVVEDKQSRTIQNISLYVMNNYQNHITLDDISKFCSMEKSSFCVFFKKQTGKPFFSYLTEYRIGLSCEMLRKTSMAISEICIASGFRDIPYYHRTFRKQMKMTPTEYRKNTQIVNIEQSNK